MARLIMLACAALVVAWHAPVAAQQTAKVDLKEWDVQWGGRTRDPAVAPDGKVWFVGQAGNYIAWFDPKTEQFKRFEIEEGTNPHNLIVDQQGIVWYAGNRNGRIGRQLPGMFEEVRLDEISVAPHTVLMHWPFFQQLFGGTLSRAREQGRLAEPDIVSWLEPLSQAARAGRFFAARTGFIVAGRKP